MTEPMTLQAFRDQMKRVRPQVIERKGYAVTDDAAWVLVYPGYYYIEQWTDNEGAPVYYLIIERDEYVTTPSGTSLADIEETLWRYVARENRWYAIDRIRDRLAGLGCAFTLPAPALTDETAHFEALLSAAYDAVHASDDGSQSVALQDLSKALYALGYEPNDSRIVFP